MNDDQIWLNFINLPSTNLNQFTVQMIWPLTNTEAANKLVKEVF